MNLKGGLYIKKLKEKLKPYWKLAWICSLISVLLPSHSVDGYFVYFGVPIRYFALPRNLDFIKENSSLLSHIKFELLGFLLNTLMINIMIVLLNLLLIKITQFFKYMNDY